MENAASSPSTTGAGLSFAASTISSMKRQKSVRVRYLYVHSMEPSVPSNIGNLTTFLKLLGVEPNLIFAAMIDLSRGFDVCPCPPDLPREGENQEGRCSGMGVSPEIRRRRRLRGPAARSSLARC